MRGMSFRTLRDGASLRDSVPVSVENDGFGIYKLVIRANGRPTTVKSTRMKRYHISEYDL